MFEISMAMKSSFMTTISTARPGFPFVGRNISNPADIRAACEYIYVRKAVLYKKRYFAQRFALRDAAAKAALNMLLDELAQKVWLYFNGAPYAVNTQENYDQFFDELCTWFLNGLNGVRSSAGLADATYGNAQKMINILFKYLTCFDDYPRYSDLFSYCHTPIDNEILEKFILIGVPNCIRAPHTKLYCGSGWYELSRDQYWQLIHEYRGALIPPIKSPALPFLAVDFCWWGMPGTPALPTIGAVVPKITNINR